MDKSVVDAIRTSVLRADFLAYINKRKGCIAVVGEFPHTEESFFEVTVFVKAKSLVVSEPYIGRSDKGEFGVAVILMKNAPPNIQREALRLRAAVADAVHPEVDLEPVAGPSM